MLQTFIENWKKEALNYYLELNETYQAAKFTEAFKDFYNNVSKKDYDILVTKMDKIESYIEREAEKKAKDFIKKVERKAGKILDMSDLTIGKDGSLNGRVIGESNKVEVETIMAGGYNIQILHYRVLVKIIK